jgi:hypothetical protein
VLDADGINVNSPLTPAPITTNTLGSGWANTSGNVAFTGSPTVVVVRVNIHGTIDNAANIQRPAAVVELWRTSGTPTNLVTMATGYIRDATDHEEASWSCSYLDTTPGTNPAYEIRTRRDSTNTGAVTSQSPSTVSLEARTDS